MRISDWSSDVCSSDLIVLDPFFGTGTTGAVARRLGRHWIGIEREEDYCEVALERIAAALPLDESALTIMQSPKTQPRVAFGTLVENGYVKPGAVLFEIGRASCRERVGQYVWFSVGAVSLNKKKKHKI